MTDHDREPVEGSNVPATLGEETTFDGRTAPVTESREHGDDRELLVRETDGTDPETGDDGFVWCETASTSEPTGGGFEWCEPAGEERRGSTTFEGSGDDPETEIDPEIGTDSGTDAGSEGYSLPRNLVTTTRVTGDDDEAVALLSALRRDPDSGRWRRAVAEHDDE